MGRYLVTGAAGFIGSRVSELLAGEGHQVVGLDNLNDSYDVRLKEWRLARLHTLRNFHFAQQDIGLQDVFREQGPFDGVINLAARAGVRASV